MITRKPLDLPEGTARAFIKDMRAYFAEQDQVKRDAIAARQMTILRDVQPPREKKLRLSDVKTLFSVMRDVTK